MNLIGAPHKVIKFGDGCIVSQIKCMFGEIVTQNGSNYTCVASISLFISFGKTNKKFTAVI